MHKFVSKKNIGLALVCFVSAGTFAIKPAEKFDLSYWNITLPLDDNRDGKPDMITVKDLKKYSHPDFFYLDADERLVFTSPNKATTTSGSSNSRSELRQMLRGKKTKIKTKTPRNNFSLKAHKKAKKFGSIGGKLAATVKVEHVALNAKHPDKYPAYSVVVGQVHAGKDGALIKAGDGYGWGNEPIKIYYKKWPNHTKGSVFWTYERNLPKADPRRTDIAYPVWGNTWENKEEPLNGVALNDEFSYVINVHKNIMYLTFEADQRETVQYEIDLSNNVDAYGKVDANDHPHGYSGDWFYFKAGAYNQCSSKDGEGFWYTGCAGTGHWKTDKANGDYTKVSFSKLELSDSEGPKKP